MESDCVTINKIDSYAINFIFVYLVWNFNSKHICMLIGICLTCIHMYVHLSMFSFSHPRDLTKISHIHFNGELCIQTFVCVSRTVNSMTQNRHYHMRYMDVDGENKASMAFVWLQTNRGEILLWISDTQPKNKSKIYSGFFLFFFFCENITLTLFSHPKWLGGVVIQIDEKIHSTPNPVVGKKKKQSDQIHKPILNDNYKQIQNAINTWRVSGLLYGNAMLIRNVS